MVEIWTSLDRFDHGKGNATKDAECEEKSRMYDELKESYDALKLLVAGKEGESVVTVFT